MTRFAIDAPTLVHVAQAGTAVGDGHQLVAPRSIRTDALQLLLTEVRAGTRTEADALALHERMTELKFRALGDRVSRARAWQLARSSEWDDLRAAEYVAVAALQADALVTTDPTLRARAAGVVPVAPVSALFESASDN